jgi:hypothetical protein
MKKIDLTGKQFGRWTVLEQAPRTYQTMWVCECACGTKREVSGANLRTGHSVSCGCYREDNRPNLAKNRDYSGVRNPRARKNIERNGGTWVPSSSVWYKRAAGIYHSAKKHGVPLGFDSAAELASYIMSIAPNKCPVFDMPFSERGNGFSNWAPSIDKIDPKQGYVRGNIQVISMLANCMKRNASPDQLEQFARWVLRSKL